MCSFESFSDLLSNGQGFVDGDRPLTDPISKRRPFDQLQNQRPRVAGLLQPVDRANVGMVQRGQDLRFTLEAGQPVGVCGVVSRTVCKPA